MSPLTKGGNPRTKKGEKGSNASKEKERKQEKERESVAINYECEKSALLANFFILICLYGVIANKYAVFCENARGITLAHYIYMYIDEQTLSFSLSLSLSFKMKARLCHRSSYSNKIW